MACYCETSNPWRIFLPSDDIDCSSVGSAEAANTLRLHCTLSSDGDKDEDDEDDDLSASPELSADDADHRNFGDAHYRDSFVNCKGSGDEKVNEVRARIAGSSNSSTPKSKGPRPINRLSPSSQDVPEALCLGAYWRFLLTDEASADVCLEPSDLSSGSTDRPRAHRLVLFRFPFFRKLLAGTQTSRTQGSKEMKEVAVRGVTLAALRRVLFYVYTDDAVEAVNGLSSSLAELIAAADICGMPALRAACEADGRYSPGRKQPRPVRTSEVHRIAREEGRLQEGFPPLHVSESKEGSKEGSKTDSPRGLSDVWDPHILAGREGDLATIQNLQSLSGGLQSQLIEVEKLRSLLQRRGSIGSNPSGPSEPEDGQSERCPSRCSMVLPAIASEISQQVQKLRTELDTALKQELRIPAKVVPPLSTIASNDGSPKRERALSSVTNSPNARRSPSYADVLGTSLGKGESQSWSDLQGRGSTSSSMTQGAAQGASCANRISRPIVSSNIGFAPSPYPTAVAAVPAPVNRSRSVSQSRSVSPMSPGPSRMSSGGYLSTSTGALGTSTLWQAGSASAAARATPPPPRCQGAPPPPPMRPSSVTAANLLQSAGTGGSVRTPSLDAASGSMRMAETALNSTSPSTPSFLGRSLSPGLTRNPSGDQALEARAKAAQAMNQAVNLGLAASHPLFISQTPAAGGLPRSSRQPPPCFVAPPSAAGSLSLSSRRSLQASASPPFPGQVSLGQIFNSGSATSVHAHQVERQSSQPLPQRSSLRQDGEEQKEHDGNTPLQIRFRDDIVGTAFVNGGTVHKI